jgi:hypothetical protein
MLDFCELVICTRKMFQSTKENVPAKKKNDMMKKKFIQQKMKMFSRTKVHTSLWVTVLQRKFGRKWALGRH